MSRSFRLLKKLILQTNFLVFFAMMIPEKGTIVSNVKVTDGS
jgi:hypothetical protein